MKSNMLIKVLHDSIMRAGWDTGVGEVEINYLSAHESDTTVSNYKLFLQRMYEGFEANSHKACKVVYDNVIESMVDDGYVDDDCELIRTMGINASRYQDLSAAQKLQVHCLATAATTLINTKGDL
jgi:hypothetical protein